MIKNYDYNIEVSKEKTSKLTGNRCEWKDCLNKGRYRAPMSHEQIHTYRWFCIEHVRIYNQSWNYYEDMSAEDIDKQIRSDTTWNRPTWPIGNGKYDNFGNDKKNNINLQAARTNIQNIDDPFALFLEETLRYNLPKDKNKKDLSKAEIKALSIFELNEPVNVQELKQRYKSLVKKYHPDITGGDKKAEERFKDINEAYELIKTNLITA